MSSKKWQISRRTMLRGMGAAIALPLLDAMVPSRAYAAKKAAKAPVRMACMYFPNGVWMDTWIPKAAGAEYELPYALEPLAEFKSAFNIFSGLDKAQSKEGDGHYAKTANFLTGLKVTKTTGKDISVGGISMDQLAAQHVGSNTPLPSLELGIDPVISGIDSNVGFTRLYGSYISWRSANVPVAKEINPRFVYERLFGNNAENGSKRQAKEYQSLLDRALADATTLRNKLGRDDQVKLDEYLESVRAVEKRIEFGLNKKHTDWKPNKDVTIPEPPDAKPPANFQDHVKLMLDLMVLAFQTDSTRVQSFMFANDVSGRNFSFLPGVSGGHHDMSHHENKAEKIAQYREINRWHIAQLAYLLGKMREVKEGEGTLLDNSMILFGSSISDGNRHDPNNLPIVVAGNAGGAFKTGQHIASEKGTPLCNLYLTMLGAMGVPDNHFGDSTGKIKDMMVT
ncbi:MAG: DUF1552 domain-containing protein [Candidatus Hydrogenedentes bacterium]|nr:DUF1552 domain-containing protein [Candidatus Hydrogenedentota bacterium]